MKVYKVAVTMKSGVTVSDWFKRFDVIKYGGEVSKLEWEAYGSNSFLYINIPEIESIVIIEEKEVDK